MYKIRQIKYSKGSVSIQVYKIENRKRKIIRHIGTAKTEQEKAELMSLANDFIKNISKQIFLFEEKESNKILHLDKTEFAGVYHTYFYELIYRLIITIGLDKIKHKLLLDLVIMRVFEPASKLRSIMLIEEYFGIKHRRQNYYNYASEWLSLKDKAENIVLNFAKKHYSFEFDLLFYDVTTLYFEAFEEDDLRKNGFSKDNKHQQPQILVALMVSKEGFPIAYEIFPGNTFEGHTIVPVIKRFINKNKVETFTVVADAAMISDDNIKNLKEEKIHYIVGARLGNLSYDLINKIDKIISRKDGENIRIETNKGFLVCSYSSTRYRKDKYEMEKQIEKAKHVVKNPSKSKKLKFTKSDGQKLELNQKLINKTKKLLGLKGYYTDLEERLVTNEVIIERYHELYRIEQAFRIVKSDLQTRPIFHFKEEPLKLHLLICFMALVISKHIELESGISIKKFICECKKVTDARLLNHITGKEVRIRAMLTPTLAEILPKFKLLT